MSVSSALFRLCVALVLSLALFGRCRCEEAVVGTADVLASELVSDGPVAGHSHDAPFASTADTDTSSGPVAALLSPRLAACVVKAQPGLARFIREHAAYYPGLRLVYTGDSPRLQIFHSQQHRRANIVDSAEESDEQLIERLQHPDSQPHRIEAQRSTEQGGTAHAEATQAGRLIA